MVLTTSEYTALQDNLTFVQEHDEHADIASGAHSINASLTEKITSQPDETAMAAQMESEVSEPPCESSIHQHLCAATQQIKGEIKKHGQPSCYQHGDFFYCTAHPVFALRDASIHGLQPDRLCARDIFVWLPLYLPGAPASFRCTCGGRLTKNGFFFSNLIISNLTLRFQ
jgi:hypothetical protein